MGRIGTDWDGLGRIGTDWDGLGTVFVRQLIRHLQSVEFEDSVGWLIFDDDTDLRHVLKKQGVSYGEFRNGIFFVTKIDRY